ncbi:LacI family DNA-binding transcriptional regulator [Olsenella sp. DNF00959]|uniref:LacI family DNA-binding transcriptional regulator n=1 Tax=Olsenella sp. DNF00959 TaxID=1476999 RepID=UPI000784CC85|nr:LacI family DNA-binding transcriptional regulator [Olsenella sp. DNF00959]KXB64227.1 transcriptional regulator, LacI family [Olsenella sp. DNF00959]
MTINEIAQMANVSRATVSRYLNDGYVSEEKRKRIARVIEQTGYVPSQQARTLRTGKTQFVGVIIPKISSESIAREVAGITSVLGASGYSTVLANTDGDGSAEISYIKSLADQGRSDGIILIGTEITEEHERLFRSLPLPLVVLGQHVKGVNCVYFNDYDSMYDLALCCTVGSSHPAFIAVPERDYATGFLRRKAFVDAIGHQGFDVDAAPIEEGRFNAQSGFDCAARIMEAHPQTDAIVCATDEIAAGALLYLHDSGRVVPGDVRLTGLGDSMLAKVVSPSLTTAHYYYRTSGAEAARMLLELMEQSEAAPHEVKMGYKLVLGGSTHSPA